MDLVDYVTSHTVRGACTCGRCIDSPPNPEECQPENHTVDMMFFNVARANDPDKAEFINLVREEYPNWLDGEEHNYLQMGADVGDQGIALVTMALGSLLEVWQLFTPRNMMPSLPPDLQMQMAGMGMVSIKVN